MTTPTAIARLRLTSFRSYASLDLGIEPSCRLVALTGPNGAGKTNLLEALSLLAPGRGLRRADPASMASAEGDGSFAVFVEAQGALGPVQLATGLDAAARLYRIDRQPVSSATPFADHLRVLWLTPGMDGLFGGPPSERRRFLDRLVLAVDAAHGARVNALERALRNRNRLLEEARENARWLDAAEHEVADLAVAVAAARADTVRRLAALIEAGLQEGGVQEGGAHEGGLRGDPVFPFALLAIEGDIEKALLGEPAASVEERYRAALREARARDRAAGRTLAGPHLSDLKVMHGPKRLAAEQASTGEQKALLVGLVLAHAQLVARLVGAAPVMLLDEVAAHLDPHRRAALFDRLEASGSQVWLTGADAAAFEPLGGRAAMHIVSPGRVRRI